MTPASSPEPAPPTPPSVAAPSTPVASRRAPQKKDQAGGVKETIEQILVAFILAFIFRCFIVEAFVIPTGSMAPTLLGANIAFRCPDCGWKWTVNYSSPTGNDDSVPGVANEAIPARCANCGYKLPRVTPGDPDNDATLHTVRFGDRILVQKYIYLLHEPERWDVVVFKSPADDQIAPNGVEPYTQNYIKRLVGKPGETIMVLDGDIYVAPADKPLDQITPGDFVVQTKPYNAQQALWRIVYDADHEPRGLPRQYIGQQKIPDATAKGGFRSKEFAEIIEDPWRDPWVSADRKWTRSGRGYAFNSIDGRGELKFDPQVAPERHALTDWLAYDVTQAVAKRRDGSYADSFVDKGYDTARGDPINPVSDLKLEATYQRRGGDGPVRFNLTKAGYRFTAELDGSKIRLLMKANDASEAKELASAAWSPGSSLHRIEFTNVDYRVSLRIDGKEVLTSTPEQFKPDVKTLLDDYAQKQPQEQAKVWIDAEKHECTLTHVSLWRDVYYLNKFNKPWLGAQSYFWAMPDDFPVGSSYGKLIQLGKDEYFVMGDNSMMSADARVWRSPIRLSADQLDVEAGRVPARFLLGRAFFVYWPAGFAPFAGLPAFAPNFGEMRFIH